MARFYDFDNGWREDFDFCDALVAKATSVLDLGCGTGTLATHLAQKHGCTVVAVDPARAMLDIASSRVGGEAVEWVHADARTLRLERQFDLVLLTGHAFQVFLTREDRRATLETIAAHLMPTGRFIFDSRNPACREWTQWTPALSYEIREHPEWGPIASWNDVEQDPDTGIVTYSTCYRIEADGQKFTARSRIAFPERSEIDTLLDAAGLTVDEWFGDWQGKPWRADAPEIIPLGRRA